jgi:hypothetical protein
MARKKPRPALRATVRPNGKARFSDGHKLILKRGRKGQLRAVLIEPEKAVEPATARMYDGRHG